MGSRKKDPPSSETTIGIDFGSSKCCVGLVRNGKVEILENEFGNKTTPSYVAFTEAERLVGESALHQVALNPTNTVFGAKQLLGRKGETPGTIKALTKHLPYDVTPENGGVRIKVTYKDKEKKLSPEQIAAMLLSQLKKLAEKHLDSPVRKAVIAVPAHFTNAQRRALKDAGTIAGLTVLGLISETTAAAVAYQDRKTFAKKQNVLVVDIGGGAFNVAVIEVQDASVEVKAICGTTELSGGELDRVLVEHLAARFTKLNKVDVKGNKKASERLKIACQKAKHTLTLLPEAVVQVDCLVGTKDFSDTIKRAELNEKYLPAAQETIKKVLCNVLSDATLSALEIDEVLLIGGTTRIPAIQEVLVEFFAGKPLNKTVNPDEAVAHGAALQAAILAGDNTVAEVRVTDIVKNPVDYADRFRKQKSFVSMKTIRVPEAESFSVVYCERIGRKNKSILEHVVDSFGVYSPKGNPEAIRNQPKTHVDLMKVNCYLNDVEIREMKRGVEAFDNEELNYNRVLNAVSVLEALCFKVKNELLPVENSEKEASDGHVSKRTEALTYCEECLEWLGRHEVALVEFYQKKTNMLQNLFEAAETEMMSKPVDVTGHTKESNESCDVDKAQASESVPSIFQTSDLRSVPAGHDVTLHKEVVMIEAENSNPMINGELEQPVNDLKTMNEINEQESNSYSHSNEESVSTNDGSTPQDYKLDEQNNATMVEGVTTDDCNTSHDHTLEEKNNATMVEGAPTDDGNTFQDHKLEEKKNATMVEGAPTDDGNTPQHHKLEEKNNAAMVEVAHTGDGNTPQDHKLEEKNNATMVEGASTDDGNTPQDHKLEEKNNATMVEGAPTGDDNTPQYHKLEEKNSTTMVEGAPTGDDNTPQDHKLPEKNNATMVEGAPKDKSFDLLCVYSEHTANSGVDTLLESVLDTFAGLDLNRETVAAKRNAPPPQDTRTAAEEASKPQEVTASDEASKPQVVTAVDKASKPQEVTAVDEASKQEVTAVDEASKPQEVTAVDEASKTQEVTAADEASKPQDVTTADDEALKPQEVTAADDKASKQQEVTAADDEASKPQEVTAADHEASKPHEVTAADDEASKPQEVTAADDEASKLQETLAAEKGAAKKQGTIAAANGATKEQETIAAANGEAEKQETPAAANVAAKKPETPAAANEAAKKPETPAAANGTAKQQETSAAANGEAEKQETPAAANGAAEKQATPANANGAAEKQETLADANGAAKQDKTIAAANGAAKKQETLAGANKAARKQATIADANGAAKQETPPAANGTVKQQTTPAAANRAAKQQKTPAAAKGASKLQEPTLVTKGVAKQQENIEAAKRAAKLQDTIVAAETAAKPQETIVAAKRTVKQQTTPPAANGEAKQQETILAGKGASKQETVADTTAAANQSETLAAANEASKSQDILAAENGTPWLQQMLTVSKESHIKLEENRLVQGNHRTEDSPLEPYSSSSNLESLVEGEHLSEAVDLQSQFSNGSTDENLVVTIIRGLAASVTPGDSIDLAGHQGGQQLDQQKQLGNEQMQRDELSREAHGQAGPMTKYGVTNEEQLGRAHYEKTSPIQPTHNHTALDTQSQNGFQQINGNGELGILSGNVNQHHASQVDNADSDQISGTDNELKEENKNFNNPHRQNGSSVSGQQPSSLDHNTVPQHRRGSNTRAGQSFHSTRGYSNGRHPPPPPVTLRQGGSAGPQRLNDRMHPRGEEQIYYQHRPFSNSRGRGRGLRPGSRDYWSPYPDYGHRGINISADGWPAAAQPSYFYDENFQFWKEVDYEYHSCSFLNGCFYCKLNLLGNDQYVVMRKRFMNYFTRHPPWCVYHQREIIPLLPGRRN